MSSIVAKKSIVPCSHSLVRPLYLYVLWDNINKESLGKHNCHDYSGG